MEYVPGNELVIFVTNDGLLLSFLFLVTGANAVEIHLRIRRNLLEVEIARISTETQQSHVYDACGSSVSDRKKLG